MCVNDKYPYAVIENLKENCLSHYYLRYIKEKTHCYARKSCFSDNMKKTEFAVLDLLNLLACAVLLELYNAHQ